jgi:hypothetical protein
LLDFMPTMGAGEAITFGEGVALPTRIKFDLLPVNELPRSNTASFTKNWANDLPDDSFLIEVVNRWRAQTYNPDSAGYSLDDAAPVAAAAAPAPAASPQARPFLNPAAVTPAAGAGLAAQARPSIRRDINAPNQGLGLRGAAPPTAPAPQAAADSNQPSLASLIKQFRT